MKCFIVPAFPWALETWAGYTVTVYGDSDVIKKYSNTEHAFCVLNHRGDLDWMIGWILIERIGMLGVSHFLVRRIVLIESHAKNSLRI